MGLEPESNDFFSIDSSNKVDSGFLLVAIILGDLFCDDKPLMVDLMRDTLTSLVEVTRGY